MQIGSRKFTPKLAPTLATLLLLLAFVWLGNWQLGRAEFKQSEFDKRAKNTQLPPMAIKHDSNNTDKILGRKTITPGRFDVAHEAVLAYQTYKRRPGFLIITPFKIEGTNTSVLVVRGWIAHSLRQGFSKIPRIPPAEKGLIKLHGVIDRKPLGRNKTGKPDGKFVNQWPKMLIYIDLEWYRKQLNRKVMPYVVKQNFQNSPGLIADWKALAIYREAMTPDKHKGYAFQWFSLAVVLLGLYFVLNTKRVSVTQEQNI